MRYRWSRLLLVSVLAACSTSTDKTSSASAKSAARPTTTASVSRGTESRSSAGCRAATAVSTGEEKVTLTSGGAERWYFRHVPSTYSATSPVPVVVDFHGYSEGALIHTKMSGLGAYGDTHGFVTVTPQGSGVVAMWDTALGSKDMRFVGDLLDDVERTVCVDADRVFVTGLSNGAFMTSAVACAYADRVAAVAPVAGIWHIDGCRPSRAVPVVAFHGTADGFVSYDGGIGKDALSLPAPDGSGKTIGDLAPGGVLEGPSIPEILAEWANRNRCDGKATETVVAADVTRVGHSCPKGADVELYRVTGGGHTWPGSSFSQAVASVIGTTTMSISADEVMWRFFDAHPLTKG